VDRYVDGIRKYAESRRSASALSFFVFCVDFASFFPRRFAVNSQVKRKRSREA